jgi:hypothetical protein
MSNHFTNRLISSIRQAAKYDSSNFVKPQVILWPDPEKQWEVIIPKLQEEMTELLVYGKYLPSRKTGPAIWLKCMVARSLPMVDWDETQTPVIYLPGISKSDLRSLENADPLLAPIMEYQYTGSLWTHRNGKEWSVMAFLQNKDEGLALNMNQDNATKDAALKTLQTLAEGNNIQYPSHVNSDFLYELLFPNVSHNILEWMCKGDEWLNSLEPDKQQVFISLCKSKYGFHPDRKNIKAIAEKLGMKQGQWIKVWGYYKMAPGKFPEIKDLLAIAKPKDEGIGGVFSIPEDSWPTINHEQENDLREELISLGKLLPKEAAEKITKLDSIHSKRRTWVWADLGESDLGIALKSLKEIVEKTKQRYPFGSIAEIRNYYETVGYEIDYAAISALSKVKSEKDKKAVKAALIVIYTPWITELTKRFQKIIEKDSQVFTDLQVKEEDASFILFIDALRFDLGKKLISNLQKKQYKTTFESQFIPLPSLTPTCKPFLSPVAKKISTNSDCKDFRPQTTKKKDLTPHQFEVELDKKGYEIAKNTSGIKPDAKYWMELGKIDHYGHQEQAGLVHRIDELFALIEEKLEDIFSAGIPKIKIVTDHGWLLIPGKMPKEKLPKDHIETRWGRCAVLKEGVLSELIHIPWYWNKNVMIAYAPGISFFKVNQEYAHGGISLQECLTPVITVESNKKLLGDINIKHKWTGLKCTIEVSGVEKGYIIDVRTRYNDERSSVISKPKLLSGNGKISVFVEEISHENEAAFIVVTDNKGVILEKIQTVIGE